MTDRQRNLREQASQTESEIFCSSALFVFVSQRLVLCSFALLMEVEIVCLVEF